MITFEDNEKTWARLDFQILLHGGCKPYSDYTALEKDVAWLKKESYPVIECDCSKWNDKKTILDGLHNKLKFLGSYGDNWDAIQSALNEMELDENGVVVILDKIDSMNFKLAETLVDVFLTSSRRHLIFSKRLLLLIKVENRGIAFNQFAPVTFHWY